MKPLVPYLFYNGDCRQAMTFYRDCFGGNLELMTYGDAPANAGCPDGGPGGARPAKDDIMHGCLTNGDLCLMASDWPNREAKPGNSAHLNVQCGTLAEIEKLFEALGAGGKVSMALHDTFWGARFGMLVDRFGVHWMLNCPLRA